MNLTLASFESWWWPYVFILLAGSLPTNVWRWLGVVAGRRLREDGRLLEWVKAVATALIAGVIAQIIFFPSGALANSPILLRLLATIIGMIAFWYARKSVLVGVLAAQTVLVAGLFLQ